jgi:hypothetical protein
LAVEVRPLDDDRRPGVRARELADLREQRPVRIEYGVDEVGRRLALDGNPVGEHVVAHRERLEPRGQPVPRREVLRDRRVQLALIDDDLDARLAAGGRDDPPVAVYRVALVAVCRVARVVVACVVLVGRVVSDLVAALCGEVGEAGVCRRRVALPAVGWLVCRRLVGCLGGIGRSL